MGVSFGRGSERLFSEADAEWITRTAYLTRGQLPFRAAALAARKLNDQEFAALAAALSRLIDLCAADDVECAKRVREAVA